MCTSADATCTAIDLYGPNGIGNTAPVTPGDRFTTTVQLRNAGNVDARALFLSPAGCQNQPLDGGTVLADLCGTVTVAVSCATGGGTLALGPQTLTSFGQDGVQMVTAPRCSGA